jgi:hypothetical protein
MYTHELRRISFLVYGIHLVAIVHHMHVLFLYINIRTHKDAYIHMCTCKRVCKYTHIYSCIASVWSVWLPAATGHAWLVLELKFCKCGKPCVAPNIPASNPPAELLPGAP